MTIALDALADALDAHGDLALDTDVTGRTAGDGWHVTVRCASLAGRVLLDATFVYRGHPPTRTTVPLPHDGQDDAVRPAVCAIWRGDLLPDADWRGGIAQVRAADADALWRAPGDGDARDAAPCPQVWLPVNHLENVLRVLLGAWPADGEPPRTWRIGGIAFGAACAADAELLLRYPDGRFAIADRGGASIADLRDARLAGATGTQAAAAPVL